MRLIVPLIVVLVALPALALSQMEKGNWSFGATTGAGRLLSDWPGDFNFRLDPSAGYFLRDNLFLGAQVNYQRYVDGPFQSSEIGASIFARYYVGKGRLRAIGEASLGYSDFTTELDATEDHGSAYHVFGARTNRFAIGASYRIAPGMYIESSVGANYGGLSNTNTLGRFSGNIGLTFFRNKK